MTSKFVFVAVFSLFVCIPIAALEADNIDALIADLGSQNNKTVESAIEAVSDLGMEGRPAVPALVALLRSPEPLLRAHAAIALGGMGQAALRAALPLAKLVTDSDPDVRHAALDALAEIRPAQRMIVPLLLSALKDQDQAVVRRAITALARRGKAIGPAMIEAVKDDRTEFYALLVLQELEHLGGDVLVPVRRADSLGPWCR